jgi:hypothetical protein
MLGKTTAAPIRTLKHKPTVGKERRDGGHEDTNQTHASLKCFFLLAAGLTRCGRKSVLGRIRRPESPRRTSSPTVFLSVIKSVDLTPDAPCASVGSPDGMTGIRRPTAPCSVLVEANCDKIRNGEWKERLCTWNPVS